MTCTSCPVIPKSNRRSLKAASSPTKRLYFICLAFALFASCRKEQPLESEQPSHSPESTQTAAAQEVRQKVHAMASRHHANWEWKTADYTLFTVELEDNLLSRSGPLLLTCAKVIDIQRHEGQHQLIVYDYPAGWLLLLRLTCSQSQAEYVMDIARKGGYFGCFAIVFRAESVRQPSWELTAQPDCDTAYIAIRESRVCLVNGESIELLYVGQDTVDLKEMLGTDAPG